jgi:hypothetical protein
MNLARLSSKIVASIAVGGALGSLALVGCSSDSGNGGTSGGGCHVNQGHCHDCGVASCGDKVTATFGANWQSLDFTGGACAPVASCQCHCNGDYVCAQSCADGASDACKTTANDLQKCLDAACFGCQAFEIGPMPPAPTFDGGFDSPGFDSPGFDSPGFDTTPFDTAPACRLDGEACLVPEDCCSLACTANICGA